MVIEVTEWRVGPNGPTDIPARLGACLSNFTQQGFRLMAPPGHPFAESHMDIDLCLDCADALTPEEYPALMDANRRAWALELQSRPANERTQAMWRYSQLWIGGRTVRRYWTAEDNGAMRVDRR